MGRKRYQSAAHTGPIGIGHGENFWKHLSRQFDENSFSELIAAFFRRATTRQIAVSLGLNRNTVMSYFRAFQSRISRYQFAQQGFELCEMKLRRTSAHDVQPWINVISREIGRPVHPLFAFCCHGDSFRIDSLEPDFLAPNPSKGKSSHAVGIVVSIADRDAPVRRHRSLLLRTRIDSVDDLRDQIRLQEGTLNPLKFGTDLMMFLKQFRGIPRSLFHDHLMEFEWKDIVRRTLLKKPSSEETAHYKSQLRKVLKMTEPTDTAMAMKQNDEHG